MNKALLADGVFAVAVTGGYAATRADAEETSTADATASASRTFSRTPANSGAPSGQHHWTRSGPDEEYYFNLEFKGFENVPAPTRADLNGVGNIDADTDADRSRRAGPDTDPDGDRPGQARRQHPGP